MITLENLPTSLRKKLLTMPPRMVKALLLAIENELSKPKQSESP